MQDKIKAAQADIARLSQELEAVIEEAEKAEAMARDKLSKAHEKLRNLLVEADSHLPQADRFFPAPKGRGWSSRVVLESLVDGVMTVRFVGIPAGQRMQFVKKGGVWKESGTNMEVRNVPDNIAKILGQKS